VNTASQDEAIASGSEIIHSAFDQLARIHRAKLVGMFETYCDESGGADHGFIAVCGWLASVERWQRFEKEWRLLLSFHDVPYLHMKELAHFNGPYDKWLGKPITSPRTAFLKEAVGIIRETVEYGVVCVVNYEDFRKVNSRFQLKEHLRSPYALAGRFCIARSNTWMRAGGLSVREIAYVFEDGGPDMGGLVEVTKKAGIQIPTFSPSRDTEIQAGMVQLQAADFLAYEMRKAVVDHHDEFTEPEKFRKSFQAFFGCNVEQGNYRERQLLELCNTANIPIREI
jgi:hypothetical protein